MHVSQVLTNMYGNVIVTAGSGTDDKKLSASSSTASFRSHVTRKSLKLSTCYSKTLDAPNHIYSSTSRTPAHIQSPEWSLYQRPAPRIKTPRPTQYPNSPAVSPIAFTKPSNVPLLVPPLTTTLKNLPFSPGA